VDLVDGPLVRRDAEAGVARITLDSPHNRNAMSVALLTQLREALDAALADAAVRVVVVSGTGTVFCSGADLKEQRELRARGERSPVAELLVDVLSRVLDAPKPVVARVNGHARAGGLGLIGACDIAIAPQDATFAFAEVRVGVVPAVIAVTTVPRMTPRATFELFLTGETFDGRRAVEVGLLNRAVPAENLDTEVDRYVGMLRLGGPEALSHVKPMIRQVRELPAEQAFRAMAELSTERFASDEGQEGMRAFADKRPPSWVDEAT
jgi:methylglutaconyl-CoA hydratase